MRKLLNIILALAIIALPSAINGESKYLPVKGKFPSRFLIVIDKENYRKVADEVNAYAAALHKENLGAELLIGEWDSPEILKNEIIKIYNRKPVLEGAVFIGRIPIVRVRNFQHATTAFKMDEEKFPIDQSSVTSDRFYDDLDLQFDFIKRDSLNSDIYYYKLKESSPQKISSEFYTARMLPPSDYGEDPSVMLGKYLKKVVKAHENPSPADFLKVFNGNGYNSDCLTVWQEQQIEMEEDFPQAFKQSEGNRFYNFRQNPFMREEIYDILQKEETDLFIFHEHGDYDTQYINGELPAPNTINGKSIGTMDALQISLRNMFRKYNARRRESLVKSVKEEYGLGEEMFRQPILDSLMVSDSLMAAGINIMLPDIKPLKPLATAVIFDACYNGSFHQKGYVAGYYIFGEGNTVVTQGNTVNVLQDKWTAELLGMLSMGARIGFWQKEIQFLESHLLGDPTIRFVTATDALNGKSASARFNLDLAAKSSRTDVWLKYLKSGSPALQAIALKKLENCPPANYSGILFKYLKESPYVSVRMEALKRMIDRADKTLPEGLRIALNDPSELIRRNGARYAGYCGDESLIKPLISNLLFNEESQRVQYAAQSSLPMFDINEVTDEIKRQLSVSRIWNKDDLEKDLCAYFRGEQKKQDKSLAQIIDKKVNTDDRISAVRSLRNYNNHKIVDQLTGVLKDATEDLSLRVNIAEALGWFGYSIEKDKIVTALSVLLSGQSVPEELQKEARQSLNRFSIYNK